MGCPLCISRYLVKTPSFILFSQVCQNNSIHSSSRLLSYRRDTVPHLMNGCTCPSNGLRVPYHCWSESETCKLLDMLSKSDIGLHWFLPASSLNPTPTEALSVEQGLCLRLLDGTDWMNCMVKHGHIVETGQGSLGIGEPWRKDPLSITRRMKNVSFRNHHLPRTVAKLVLTLVLGPLNNLQAIQADHRAQIIWNDWKANSKYTWYFKYVALRQSFDPDWLESRAISLQEPITLKADPPIFKWNQARTIRLLDLIASSKEYKVTYFPGYGQSHLPNEEDIEKQLCLKTLDKTYWMTKMIHLGYVVGERKGKLVASDNWTQGCRAVSMEISDGIPTDIHYIYQTEWQKEGTNTWYFKFVALENASGLQTATTDSTPALGVLSPYRQSFPRDLPTEGGVMTSPASTQINGINLHFDPDLFNSSAPLFTQSQDVEALPESSEVERKSELLELVKTLLFTQLEARPSKCMQGVEILFSPWLKYDESTFIELVTKLGGTIIKLKDSDYHQYSHANGSYGINQYYVGVDEEGEDLKPNSACQDLEAPGTWITVPRLYRLIMERHADDLRLSDFFLKDLLTFGED
ncbi:hypothetical protein IAT40_000312 [Kwoniella sp. CBS 6097]